MRFALVAFFAATLWAQSRPVLRGGVQENVGPTFAEVFKDRDPETGQGISQNELTERGGRGNCPTLRPPAILVYHNTKTHTCYYWIPNDPDEQDGRPNKYTQAAPRGPCDIDPNLSQAEQWKIFNSPDYIRRCTSGNPGPPPPAYSTPRNPSPPASNAKQNRNTITDPRRFRLEYVHGVADGAFECLQGFADMFAGVGFALRGDFQTGAALMGLAPGQSVTLQLISREISDTLQRTKMSPYEAGKVGGRRFCLYGLAPGAQKAERAAGDPRTPGKGPFNPVEPNVAFRTDVAAAPGRLANQWVRTPAGPKRLGPFVGRGSFGSVFENGENPKQVIKVSNANPDSAASFPRQAEGSRVLKQAGIPTPTVRQVIPAGADSPAFLVMDNLKTEFPKAFEVNEFLSQPVELRNAIRQATKKLFTDIGKLGYVWPDGHLGNLAFERLGDGTLRAIVVDADMMLPKSALDRGVAGAGLPGKVMTTLFWGTEFQGALWEPHSPAQWMDMMHQVRYPADAVPPTGTVPN